MTKQEFTYLMNEWRSNRITRQDAERFLTAARTGEYNELMDDTFESHIASGDLKGLFAMEGAEKSWEKMEGKLFNQAPQMVHRVHFLRTAWFRVAVAVLIILTGVLVYTNYFYASDTGKELVKGPSLIPDILPGGNKAVLTLADGSQIMLDSAATGKLAQQNGATIQKSGNGEIIYAFDKTTVTGSVVYNTMSTPRGGQYQLILPDGSKVWLNAESSITFPTAFIGNTREITMTGEAYFEIKADKQKPFIVKTASDEIQVLGTSFNINAYDDAPVKTSLLQGSVKVKTTILKPGQAFINGKIIATNLEQDIAWKNGEFNFSGLNAKQTMSQIGRWYNVDIRYAANVEDVKLRGVLTRSIALSDLLKGLQGIGGLHLSIEKNTVIVSRDAAKKPVQ